jgi:predicted RNA binding protein YcfA (HicA-like mRNA interferase family)
MPRLTPLPPRDVERILKRNGLRPAAERPHGTDWLHPDDPERRTTVPRKTRIAKGTLSSIARQAKKAIDEFKAG